MRKLLAVLLASGMVSASAGAGLAECSWGMAHKGTDMTVAESTSPDVQEEAMTTFDPQTLLVEEEARESDDARADVDDD